MKTSLSPRDIQTRIRAGESLEDVGRLAGIPLDRVERFAAPVLAEREHIAAVAMSASVRRRGETSGHRSLRITVTERLVTRGVDIDTMRWDSYRLDDGRWAVTADYPRVRRTGTPPSPSTRAAGSRSPATTRPVGCSASTRRPRARSRSAPTRPASAPAGEDTEPTVDLSDELALVRATREPMTRLGRSGRGRRADRRRPAVAAPGGRPAPAARRRRLQRGLAAGLPRAERRHRGAARPARRRAGSRRSWSTTRSSPASRSISEPTDRAPAATRAPAIADEPPVADGPGHADRAEPPGAPSRRTDACPDGPRPRSSSPSRARAAGRRASPARRKRATVPSWDEIMFGGPKRSR